MWKPQQFQELDSEAYTLQRALESRQKDHEGDIIVQALQMSSNVSNFLRKSFKDSQNSSP